MIKKRIRKLSDNSYTPLHFVAEKNSINIAEILLSKGAAINVKGMNYQIRILILDY